jgi:YebC/PmpR family DNA-binding regulatory protein
MNPTLRTMFQKARDASVPRDTIEKAIKRGTGELEGVNYEEVTYEGYAPGGVAVMVEALTDNRNRTGADVRSTFSKLGGSLAEPGAVAWQFERKGIVLVTGVADEDQIMMAALEAGADDVSAEGDMWAVTCEATDTASVRSALEEAGITVESSDLTMIATSTVDLATAEDAKPVLRLLDALDDLDDVQNVHTNADVDDDVVAALEG